MHTFRFNSVFRHWVLLGSPVSREINLTDAHLLHSGVKGEFLAATNPKHPFLMDPPRRHGMADALVHEQPPLGEYELILYKGEKSLKNWGAKEWEKWLELAQERLLQMHENTHIHHVQLSLHTGWLDSVGKTYSRVGDIIATSHPIAGSTPLLDTELVQKLRHSERGYILHDGPDGLIYAPSAPLYGKEVWYIPSHQSGGFDRTHGAGRTHAAEALALLMKALLSEWPKEHFVLELVTSMANRQEDSTWWLRIYQEERRLPAAPNVLPLPEKFVRDLTYLLGPGRVA